MRYSSLHLPALVSVFGVGCAEYTHVDVSSDMHLVSMSLQLYAENHDGRLPRNVTSQTGELLVSWRHALIPFLDGVKTPSVLSDDVAWDDPTFEVWRKYSQNGLCTGGSTTTQFLAIVCENSAWNADIELHDLPIGTLLMIESARDVHWLEPEDVLLGDDNVQRSIGDLVSLDRPIHVLSANGGVFTISPATPVSVLRPFCEVGRVATPEDNEVLKSYIKS